MSLLELRHIAKSYGRPPHAAVALDDVSLQLDAGELAVVWGLRRSGRSTLLRVAAGVEAPDEGSVLLEGHDLAGRGGEAVRARVAYCRKMPAAAGGHTVLDALLEPALACGIGAASASRQVQDALQRSGAEPCAKLRIRELDTAQRARVAIARALLLSPRLLVIDEPTLGVGLRQREDLLKVLRCLADDGIAVLSSTDSSTGFLGADRSLALDRGRLRGETSPELAEVLPLRRPA